MLTGACMSRAGLNRKTGLATATLVVAAEISDVDVLWAFRGPVETLQHHRGWTHSFVGVPVMAGLAVLVVWVWNRVFRIRCSDPNGPAMLGRVRLPVRWGLLFGIACLGPISHILLDYTTAYGIRMFEPFSYRWYEWDTVSIVEPFMLAVLILGLILPGLFALIHEEIGMRREQFRGRTGAMIALILVVLMWAVRDFEHRRAISVLDARAYQGEDPVRASAYPYPWNPFVWHGVVETRDFFQTVPVNSLHGDADAPVRTYYKPEETPVLEAAKRSYLGRVYLDWAQYPVTVVQPEDEHGVAYHVRFIDLRYAYPERRLAPLGASVDLSKDLQVVAQRFGRRIEKR